MGKIECIRLRHLVLMYTALKGREQIQNSATSLSFSATSFFKACVFVCLCVCVCVCAWKERD